MLKKLMSGICIMSLVGCLMVGCSSTEELIDENQETKVEETKESNLDKAYDFVMKAIEENQKEADERMNTDEYSIELIKDTDKLVIKLTMKNVNVDDMLSITNDEWNEAIEKGAKETVQIMYDALEEVEIYDVKCVEDIYVNDDDFIITRVDEMGILEDNFNEYCSIKREKINKAEAKKQKENNEMGQCYDCGEYYPVRKMTFNGRSYHCGCADRQKCAYCGEAIEPGDEHEYQGAIYCGYCNKAVQRLEKEYNEELNDEWICPDCGRPNVGDVLCECELEENY